MLLVCIDILSLCLIITVFALLQAATRKRKWKRRPPQIFFIADTHFDSRKNSRLRRFRSVRNMNGVMCIRWNRTVAPQDTVYFLGDFANHRTKIWWNRLNGRKIHIRGNHDRGRGCHLDFVTFGGIQFYLVHNYRHVPKAYQGWVIHGHSHHAPFVNAKEQRICVCANRIAYKPINASAILKRVAKVDTSSANSIDKEKSTPQSKYLKSCKYTYCSYCNSSVSKYAKKCPGCNASVN